MPDRSARVAGLLAAVLLAAAAAAAQTGPAGAPFGGAMDDHFRRDAARGEGTPSRAFAFAAHLEADVAIERVDEQRQARGGPRFLLTVRNRGEAAVPSLDLLALVVADGGGVTQVVPLPAITALKRGQTKRHEVELRGVSLAPADRLAFVIARIERASGQVWAADAQDLREMAAEAAATLFPRR
jgi:hypothetical protein